MGIASRQWQPPHLRQERQRREAFSSDPRNKLLKTGLLRHLAKLAEISDEEF
jgi:hypothetical protein